MFKNLVDSFLIIDAKDKPAPSFLTAYIFTWLIWHYETTLAFFKTKGDFTTRFNSSLIATTENQWVVVLCLTFLLVIVRFGLNNAIYYVREFIDSKTQGKLNEKGHKSFISNEVYQNLKTKITSLQNELLASQDREKSAKEEENKASAAMLDLTIDKDKFQKLYESHHKENTEFKNKITSFEKTHKTDKTNIEGMYTDIENLQAENLLLKDERSGLLEHINNISERLVTWSKRSGNNHLTLINIPEDQVSEEVADHLSKLFESSIISPEGSKGELYTALNKYIPYDESNPTHAQQIVDAVKSFEPTSNLPEHLKEIAEQVEVLHVDKAKQLEQAKLNL